MELEWVGERSRNCEEFCTNGRECQSRDVWREVGDQLLLKAHHERDSSFAK